MTLRPSEILYLLFIFFLIEVFIQKRDLSLILTSLERKCWSKISVYKYCQKSTLSSISSNNPVKCQGAWSIESCTLVAFCLQLAGLCSVIIVIAKSTTNSTFLYPYQDSQSKASQKTYHILLNRMILIICWLSPSACC